MSKYPTYKDLIVYKKSEKLTVSCYEHFTEKKYNYKYNSLIDQSLRAVGSIGANIAEGYGRHYKKSYRHFLSISRGSSFEADYWFEIMLKLEVFDKPKIKTFKKDLDEIIRMLTTLMKKLDTK